VLGQFRGGSSQPPGQPRFTEELVPSLYDDDDDDDDDNNNVHMLQDY